MNLRRVLGQVAILLGLFWLASCSVAAAESATLSNLAVGRCREVLDDLSACIQTDPHITPIGLRAFRSWDQLMRLRFLAAGAKFDERDYVSIGFDDALDKEWVWRLVVKGLETVKFEYPTSDEIYHLGLLVDSFQPPKRTSIRKRRQIQELKDRWAEEKKFWLSDNGIKKFSATNEWHVRRIREVIDDLDLQILGHRFVAYSLIFNQRVSRYREQDTVIHRYRYLPLPKSGKPPTGGVLKDRLNDVLRVLKNDRGDSSIIFGMISAAIDQAVRIKTGVGRGPIGSFTREPRPFSIDILTHAPLGFRDFNVISAVPIRFLGLVETAWADGFERNTAEFFSHDSVHNEAISRNLDGELPFTLSADFETRARTAEIALVRILERYIFLKRVFDWSKTLSPREERIVHLLLFFPLHEGPTSISKEGLLKFENELGNISGRLIPGDLGNEFEYQEIRRVALKLSNFLNSL